MVCTGNTCRSPMAAALLAERLAEAGVEAVVESAGTMRDYEGHPATGHGVACMAERGLDTSAHLSRRITPEMFKAADLIVGMGRAHVREVVIVANDTWSRAFTLKELVRRGEQHGPRRSGQSLEAWLAAVSAGRRMSDMAGDSRDDDVADPVGGPKQAYDQTAALLEDLTARLARLIAPR